MSSTDHEPNRLLNLRNLLILFVGLAMATGTATVAHFHVRGEYDRVHNLNATLYLHEALGVPPIPGNEDFELPLEVVERRPEVKRFVDGLAARLMPRIPAGSHSHDISTAFIEPRQGWPLMSRRAAYNVQCCWLPGDSGQGGGTMLYADRNGLDPFSLLGFLGNVFIHAIPLTLLVAGLSWWVRSWRLKRLARRRGFPVLPVDEDA